ncbi:hypothetical protein [Microbacterium sp. A84]|uniref:hypothetical protein n=1 Tax=Microbacterium sp. A84 TaxID=3450715 RepID=UPI003F437FB7
MSNPNIAPIPVPSAEDPDDLVTTEVDGETTLDPDVNADLVDSASADRLAAGSESENHQSESQDNEPDIISGDAPSDLQDGTT